MNNQPPYDPNYPPNNQNFYQSNPNENSTPQPIMPPAEQPPANP